MERSWLFPEGVDRERMLDMDRRIRPTRKAAFGVLGLALLACGPWLGWWTIAPLLLAAVVFRCAETHIDRARRPEFGLFAAWASSQVIIAISVALTGGPSVPTMAWFAIPVVGLGARFSERGIVLGVALTLALMAAVSFGFDAHAVIARPPLLIAPVALVIAVALLQTALMHSDKDTRARAIVDGLTGMLNRQALEARVAELEQQSKLARGPIGLIVGDVDHFKAVNDSFGHAVGDAVLAAVAASMRRQLRAYDLVYRIGGEEFVVLLPGADIEQAGQVAEQLRSGLEATGAGDGHPVTMSFGVSASGMEEDFSYAGLFAQADAALYLAKRDGRNCVRRAPRIASLTPA